MLFKNNLAAIQPGYGRQNPWQKYVEGRQSHLCVVAFGVAIYVVLLQRVHV
jgi:hypothetical protein